MNNLMTSNINKMMSSKEIAELTGKLHSHVLRDIRSMIEQLDNPNLDGIDFITNFRKDNGQTESISLNHDLTMLLLTGYDVRARLKVIQRWKELEQVQQSAIPNFTDPAEAAIAWANEYKAKQLALEQLKQKEEVIEEQQPAVEFVQKYVSLDSCKTIREVAKVLDQPERNFINWLIYVKVLFRQNGELLPYAKYQQRGYFEVKTGVHSKHTYVHTVFTSQGVTWIAKKVNKWLREH